MEVIFQRAQTMNFMLWTMCKTNRITFIPLTIMAIRRNKVSNGTICLTTCTLSIIYQVRCISLIAGMTIFNLTSWPILFRPTSLMAMVARRKRKRLAIRAKKRRRVVSLPSNLLHQQRRRRNWHQLTTRRKCKIRWTSCRIKEC